MLPNTQNMFKSFASQGVITTTTQEMGTTLARMATGLLHLLSTLLNFGIASFSLKLDMDYQKICDLDAGILETEL